MERKGINYDVGIEFGSQYMSRPVFNEGIVHRELEIIRSDLHCNAVRISGTDINRLKTAAGDALSQGLEVWLSPHLHDKTEEETLNHTVRCAEMAEHLRKRWPKLVFILGCELTLFMQGILEGGNIFDRLSSPSFMQTIRTGEHNIRLNAFLSKVSKAVRNVFQGAVTYASAPLESVQWDLFDYVCLDYYREIRNKDSYVKKLQPYFAYDKPVIITEVGCCTYRGAEDAGGRGFMIIDQSKTPLMLNREYIRDEDLQADEITDLLQILNKAEVNGVFVFTFVSPALTYCEKPLFDLDMASYSLVKSFSGKHGLRYPDMIWEPKKSFDAVADYYGKNNHTCTI